MSLTPKSKSENLGGAAARLGATAVAAWTLATMELPVRAAQNDKIIDSNPVPTLNAQAPKIVQPDLKKATLGEQLHPAVWPLRVISILPGILQPAVIAPRMGKGLDKVPWFTMRTWVITDFLICASCWASGNTLAAVFATFWVSTGVAMAGAQLWRTRRIRDPELYDPPEDIGFQKKCRLASYIGWGVLVGSFVASQLPMLSHIGQGLQHCTAIAGACVSGISAFSYARRLWHGEIGANNPPPSSRFGLFLHLGPWLSGPLGASCALAATWLTHEATGKLLVMGFVLLASIPTSVGKLKAMHDCLARRGSSISKFILHGRDSLE